MLYHVLVALLVAVGAAALGTGDVAGTASGIAQILCFFFLGLLLISPVVGLFRRS